MRTFDDILQIAIDRKGSLAAVMDGIPTPKTADELAAIADSTWLSTMARGIFQAGISWKVVENKWPGIEEAFHGFDVARVAFMPDDWFEDLCEDKRIVRSPPKIRAIADNAAFIQKVSAESGGFGRRIGDWPASDFMGLLDWMQRDGARLGGSTGAYVMRYMGKDGFVLSQDVVARLIAEGVIDKAPTSAKAKAAVQDAFNIWASQSGLPLTTISRVLARSIGENRGTAGFDDGL
ncbi:MAG: DNA-3-methyladenine glycosylase I [Paracoccaceae bacterium]